MENLKNNILAIVFGGIGIFLFGIVIGFQLDNSAITSIQGYLLNAAGYATDPNATDSNATDSNATDSNATDSNATDSNATDCNATDSNAYVNDNAIYLQNFKLSTTTAKVGDKVNIEMSTVGAPNTGATIVFIDKTGTTFSVNVMSIGNNPYFVVPNNAVASTYQLARLLLVGKNSDNTTFSKLYSIADRGENFEFPTTLTITQSENQNNDLTLNSMSLLTNKANISDKVYIKYETNVDLTLLTLYFRSEDNKTFNVHVSSLKNNPYFEIPSNVSVGTYTLYRAVLRTNSGYIIYSTEGGEDAGKFAFNSTLEIGSSDNKTYVYNNEDVNSSVITKLYGSADGTSIIVNASNSSIINSDLFDVIKGKNKTLTINYYDNQIIFDGKDVTSSKTIDVNMLVDDIDSNEDINKLVSEGIIVNFPDNGNLPGKALVRVKATADVTKVLGDKIHVYVFNNGYDNFCEIQTNVVKTSDGYYEFSITHNSDYVLVNDELDSKMVVKTSPDNVVAFQKSNKTYLLLIGVGVLVLIACAVVVMIIKKKKKVQI